jgi:copper resistance protein B
VRGRPLVAFALLAITRAPLLSAQPTDSLRHGAHDMAWSRETFVMSEVLELAPASRALAFDLVGWSGGASRRLWFKLGGEAATRGSALETTAELLYGRMFSPWWDWQVGVRSDLARHGSRTASRAGVVLGVQGLAPGWFEVEPSLFVAHDRYADVSLTASTDLYVTQRLVLQPRTDATVGFTIGSAPAVGSPDRRAAFELRTRYEVRREFAPYFGAGWSTARDADAERGWRFVTGLRLWY